MSAPKYLDIHALHTLPFSNVNRDDLGAPKTMMLGGAERTRISSQSWKRMIRRHVETDQNEHTLRTRRVVVGVAERLTQQGWDQDEAEAAGVQVAVSAGKGISLKQDKDDQERTILTTNVLLLLPESSIDDLATLASEHREAIRTEAQRAAHAQQSNKGKTKVEAKLPTDTIDEIISRDSGTINLFGRMLAEVPGAHVDGVVQMAHAFTTHGTDVEPDFFTAVDDVEHNLGLPGSGHMDTGLFSAGTFYRYANLDLTGLAEHLHGDTALATSLTRAFLDGFITTVPTGQRNATAPQTPPDLVYVTVRDDRPVSLASAFDAPVSSRTGHLAPSVTRLHSHAGALTGLLGQQHVVFTGHTATPNATNHDEQRELASFGTRQSSFEALVHESVAAAYPGGPS